MTEKEQEAKRLLQEWIDKQGHDKCHYYPEIFLALCKLFDVKSAKEPNLPPREEFEEGCKKFQDELYT